MRFLLMIILISVLAGGCGETNFERSENLMGTVLTLRAVGAESKVAVEESFDRISEMQRIILADTKKIEAAAGNGDFVKVDADVYRIIAVAQEYSALTDGAFDVTIGAAVDLWKGRQIPSAEKIAVARNLVNYRNLELDGNNGVRLKVAGMKINLGGVAKGYAVDVIREIFAAHNINDGLIDFGTSTIYAIGAKKIGLKNPRGGDIAEVVEVVDGVISTSGDYEKFFIVDGRRYSHILNPKTCEPVETNIASVSVIIDGGVANCGTVADILSTAIFVAGEEILSNVSHPESVKVKIFSVN